MAKIRKARLKNTVTNNKAKLMLINKAIMPGSCLSLQNVEEGLALFFFLRMDSPRLYPKIVSLLYDLGSTCSGREHFNSLLGKWQWFVPVKWNFCYWNLLPDLINALVDLHQLLRKCFSSGLVILSQGIHKHRMLWNANIGCVRESPSLYAEQIQLSIV